MLGTCNSVSSYMYMMIFTHFSATSSMNVMVSIPGTNQILEGGTAKNSAIYTGEITKDEESGTI